MDQETLKELTRMASVATSLDNMVATVNKAEGLDLTPQQWFGVFEKQGPVRDAIQKGWERLWSTGYCSDRDRSMITWR